MEGELVSTVRLHHLTRETPEAPIMTVFGDRLLLRLARGETFIDPSRLAVDPQLSSTHRALPYVTLRLAVIANTFFNATELRLDDPGRAHGLLSPHLRFGAGR